MAVAVAAPSEYDTLTTACGLVDRSDMGKLALTGAEAKSFLTGQVSNDIEGLIPGAGCYALMLTNKGKITADLRVLDVASGDSEELLLICERAGLQDVFDVLRRSIIGWQSELHKRTVQQALFSLIGPGSDSIAGAATGGLGTIEHANVASVIGGAPVVLIRTDLGVDVVCGAQDAATVGGALLEAGAVGVSETAAEVLRVRSGRPRLGLDLDETVIPQEAGLNERAISFTKGCYVGQETVARLFYRGKPNRVIRGLFLSGDAATGDALLLGDRTVGRLGSVARTPDQGAIALALVRLAAEIGDVIDVGDDGVTATVVDLPFG